MKAKVVVIIAIILGLITSVLVYTMLGTPQQQEQEAEKAVSVVVAKDNIKERQKITADMIEIKKVPASRAHFEALAAVEKVQGRYTSAKIIAGEQILKSRLYTEKEVNSVLAFNLAPQERAITVAVNEVIGVAGFLMPGDYVDVVGVFSGTGEAMVKTVLQNVRVLAIAQDMTSNKGIKAEVEKSVTLAVDLEEAERLVLADREGEIRLALRSPKNEVKTSSSVISLDKLLSAKEETTEDELETKESDNQGLANKSSRIQGETKGEEQEKISKKVEVIRGIKRNYEDVLIQAEEGN